MFKCVIAFAEIWSIQVPVQNVFSTARNAELDKLRRYIFIISLLGVTLWMTIHGFIHDSPGVINY